MKLLFTLDYELFLGSKTGGVEACLIQPLNSYIEAVADYGVRFTIFVDAAYLYVLKKYAAKYECLNKDYHLVEQHLLMLQAAGHDIQLHIHPQWYFSTFDGKEWQLDTQHYKLSDVHREEMSHYVLESKLLLDKMIGKRTVAFRAGGFSAQPTSLLTALMVENGLLVDSSVCPGSHYSSPYQHYDYRHAPRKGMYRFEQDICYEEEEGRFWEVPISMYEVSPFFQWKLLFHRLIPKIVGNSRHAVYGDGRSVRTTRGSIIRRLLMPCHTMATIDGYKISFLKEAMKSCRRHGKEVMCILGHPKLATPYSIEKISDICDYARHRGYEFYTLTELIKEKQNSI